VARHASGILTATVQLRHFGIDLAGRFHLTFDRLAMKKDWLFAMFEANI
jgi:hypothetical protein